MTLRATQLSDTRVVVTTMSDHWSGKLVDLGAPPAMVQWAQKTESIGAAWAGCVRPDWMIWLLSRMRAGKPEGWRKIEPCLKECVAIIQQRIDAGIVEGIKTSALMECADKVREMFPKAPRLGPRNNVDKAIKLS